MDDGNSLSLNIVHGSAPSSLARTSESRLRHKQKHRKQLERTTGKKKGRFGPKNHATSNVILNENLKIIQERKTRNRRSETGLSLSSKTPKSRLDRKTIQSEFDSGLPPEIVQTKSSKTPSNTSDVLIISPKRCQTKESTSSESFFKVFDKQNSTKKIWNDRHKKDQWKPEPSKSQSISDNKKGSEILNSILQRKSKADGKSMTNQTESIKTNLSNQKTPEPIHFKSDRQNINDEFSAGFDEQEAPQTKRFEPEERRPKRFLSDEEYFEMKEKQLDEEMSKITSEEKEKLKEDFKQMFGGKGSFNYEAEERKFKPRQVNDTPRERRLATVSVFRNNPEIPNVNLPTVKRERREGVFTGKSFSSFKDILHPHLISCVENKLNISQMTAIQAESIPKILDGTDCLIKSVTGSGKSLAILIPLIQMLQAIEPNISRQDGTYALIILPTRELVQQFYEPLSVLCTAFNRIIPGYLMGGENKHSEKNRIRKGINVLICTPGRLIDHLETTKSFSLEKLRFLVIDEADRLYEAGFEDSVKKIVQAIRESQSEQKPQTLLLSATLTEGVKKLAGMVLENAQFIDTCETDKDLPGHHVYTLPENLEQSFTLVPAKLRALALTGFILKHCSYEGSAKMLVFMSTQDVVDFHFTLFDTIFNPLLEKSELNQIKFFKLHGNMDQTERMKIFNEFRKTTSGVLFCTDVASRGVDMPHVDWVLQYSCSSTLEDYVHRVGRTARIDQVGKSIIFLLPSESDYIKLVQKKLRSNLNNIEAEKLVESMIALDFSPKANSRNYREQAGQLQFVFESAVAEDPILTDLAKKAYISHSRAYASYPRALKDILPFKQMHLGHICKSFCLRESPRALGASYRPSVKKEHKGSKNKTFNGRLSTGKRPLPIEMKTSEFDSGI